MMEEAGLEYVRVKSIQLVWFIDHSALTHVECAFQPDHIHSSISHVLLAHYYGVTLVSRVLNIVGKLGKQTSALNCRKAEWWYL